MKKVLTIAGSDSSGGAGIQADLKTIAAHGLYGMSVITALTSQNTCGVFGIVNTPPNFVQSQLESVFSDIRPDSIKIGMVSEEDIINTIADTLTHYDAKNIVVDPVMVSTSSCDLINSSAVKSLRDKLFPLARVVTPNLHEASVLSGIKIETKEDMKNAAEKIGKNFNGAILIKGGHLSDSADDLLFENGSYEWLSSARIDNPNTHGTGCTLSSAIACGLAENLSVYQSVKCAKEYVHGAIADGLNLGKGRGPLNHMYKLK